MFEIAKELISELDKFHYIPQLGFKAKRNQGTFLGGLFTILVGIIIFYILGDQLYFMSQYKAFYHKEFATVANLTDIGKVNLDDMGTLPFFGIHYKGK
jgi:hypothetical protein